MITDFELVAQWRFYIDGKAWFCKVVDKKKSIFWLSIWKKSTGQVFILRKKHI